MPLPSVFAYRDYRAFLEDWLDARRSAQPGYSLKTFALAGGCSKSALANVIGGARTPRPETIDAFARAMELGPAEHDFLRLLVALADAPTLERRRQIIATMLDGERFGQARLAEHQPEEDVARYLAHWCIPAIRELAGLPGFRDDPAWVADQLVPPIDVELARHALDTLFDLGFLHRDDDGAIQQRELQFRTEPESAQLAVTSYHRDAVPQMLRNLDPSRGREQHLLTMTLALDPDQVVEVKSKLNALLQQVAALADEGSASAARRVYQLSIQLLPLSIADPGSVSSAAPSASTRRARSGRLRRR